MLVYMQHTSSRNSTPSNVGDIVMIRGPQGRVNLNGQTSHATVGKPLDPQIGGGVSVNKTG
jgi:hypothetical protein